MADLCSGAGEVEPESWDAPGTLEDTLATYMSPRVTTPRAATQPAEEAPMRASPPPAEEAPPADEAPLPVPPAAAAEESEGEEQDEPPPSPGPAQARPGTAVCEFRQALHSYRPLLAAIERFWTVLADGATRARGSDGTVPAAAFEGFVLRVHRATSGNYGRAPPSKGARKRTPKSPPRQTDRQMLLDALAAARVDWAAQLMRKPAPVRHSIT